MNPSGTSLAILAAVLVVVPATTITGNIFVTTALASDLTIDDLTSL
jgi:hypothetical protein